MKVAVIIVTYNGMRWIEKCISSCGNHDVIVIDNGSTDGTVDFIKKSFPNIDVVKNTENLGFGQANNIGISKALSLGAEHVFLLNQDAYMVSGCLETLMDTQKRFPQFGILSPVHLNGKGKDYDRQFYDAINEVKSLLPSNLANLKQDGDILNVPFVNAAAWLISRKCLLTVGGFDPIFFHYAEDNNYCQRVLYHGFKIGIVNNCFVRHDREHRPIKNYQIGSKEYWLWYERRFKKRHANVSESSEAINDLLKKRKKSFLKSLIKMDFNSLNFLMSELKIIYRLRNEVLESKFKNQFPGSHYLRMKALILFDKTRTSAKSRDR